MMSGLFGTISIALRAMQAQQGAIAGTGNNIANLNTPGYSRQQAVMLETDPTYTGNIRAGSGVELTGFQSIRDDVLELRLQEEQQQQGRLGSTLDAMNQVQTLFPADGTGLDQQLSQFFNSLSSLSVDPANGALRQGVLTAAQNLANTFHVTVGKLQKQQSDLDTQVSQAVDQVNQLTSQIAALNGKIASVPAGSSQAGTFTDERNQLVQQLANIIDVTSIRTESSISLTTANGVSLVVGNQSYQLGTQPDSNGRVQVMSGSQNMTAEIQSGKLAGLIHVRDTSIPGILSDLDTLAYGLATQFNTVHSAGYDLNGQTGTDFFVQPVVPTGAAASLAVNITDASQIAASSDAAAGGNGNLRSLISLQQQPIVGGNSPIAFYSNVVFRVGSDVANAVSDLKASDLISRQLADQRGAISGISLDEEASNLLRYQRAFEAAARVVDVISSLTDTAVNLGRR
jgi:flagellar hook-associated protein 1